MRRKKKKAVLRAVFIYLLLSLGSWMFVNSYANSRSRISGRSIVPAQLVIEDGTASVEVLGHGAEFRLSYISPDSRLYCGAYLLSPDEIRLAAYVISLSI